MTKKQIPIAKSAVAYGETVYWITIFSAIFVVVGTVHSFTSTSQDLSPSYLLSSVLDGNSVKLIWMNSSLQAMPGNHWYLEHLNSGEGLTTMGIAAGVFSIIPGTAVCAFFFWQSHNRLFAVLAVFACAVTIISMMGWISIPI